MYKRSNRCEFRRVRCKDSYVVIVARLQTGYLDGSVTSTKIANLSYRSAWVEKIWQVSRGRAPLIPFTSMVCFRDAAWLSEGFQYSRAESDVIPAKETSGMGGMSKPRSS